MAGCDCCAKAILVIVNIFFMLIGLALAAGGAVLRFGTPLIEPFIDPLLKSIPSITQGANVGDGVTASSDVDTALDIGKVFEGVSIALIVIGLFMLIMGIFGCCGACCSVKVMLIIYTVVCLIMMLIKVILIAMFFSGSFDSQIEGQLQKVIDTKFIGIDSFTVESVAWNFAMIQFKCCGVEGYQDFATAENWKKTRSHTFSGVTVTKDLVTPIACCKMDGEFPSARPTDENCAFVPTDLNNNWKTGCYDAVWDEINKQQTLVICILAGIVGFELVCAALAICIIVAKSKEKSV